MAPRGGYAKNRARGVEYVPVSDVLDAEGKIMAREMGIEYPVWVADAIAHHLYRCEQMECQARLKADELAAQRRNDPSPVASDPQYQPRRPRPTITRPKPAGGARPGPGRSPGQ